MRVKRGFVRRRRRNRVLKHAKGFFLGKRNLYNIAKQAVEKALAYAYTGRRLRKRDFRGIWVVRIGAAAKQNGLSYSRLIHGLKQAGVGLDRKSLADLAATDPQAFAKVAEVAKGALAAA
jgi:large subunit ribosomal protein L20